LENAQQDNPEVENHQLEAELDEEVDRYAGRRGTRIKAALKKLREVGAGNALAPDLRRLAPHGADATLIHMWAAAEKATHRIEPKTIDRQARRMSKLSEWLRTHDRPPMAGRLSTPAFVRDLEEYRRETNDKKINADLVKLGGYEQILEANRALGLRPPEDPGQPSWEAARQPHALQGPPATPASPSAGAWDWLGEQIQGPASPEPAPHWGAQAHPPLELPATPATPSQGAWAWLGQQMQDSASPSCVRPRSSNIYGGLDSFVDLDPPHTPRLA
jgi:type III effector protein XopD